MTRRTLQGGLLPKAARAQAKPIRIQRKRVKGFKLPPNTVSVTRPGKWGNPFKIGDRFVIPHVGRYTLKTPADVVELYRSHITDTFAGLMLREKAREELRGKNLACFCRIDQPCHADVLLEIANA